MKCATARTRRFGVLLAGAVLAASLVALAGTEDAEARKHKATAQIFFTSDRSTGEGVNNPTGDTEIFVMKPDGTGLKQLTFNTVFDSAPALRPDGKKVAFTSSGVQTSNPEGDFEIYLMNLDGSDQQNLTNNSGGVFDSGPDFSPDAKEIAYTSNGVQTSNPEGDNEVYLMTALDGSEQHNLTDTDDDIEDSSPDFSPDGTKITYQSFGIQTSNPEGDREIYLMNSDGSGSQNLTFIGLDVGDRNPDFSPKGTKIAYEGAGDQPSNPEGDSEIYGMNALDGSNQKNLTSTAEGIFDTSPTWAKRTIKAIRFA
jgi:TolB protein